MNPFCKTHRSMKVDHMHHLLRDILSLYFRDSRFTQLHFVPLFLNVKQRYIYKNELDIHFNLLTRVSTRYVLQTWLSKFLTFKAKCRSEHIHVCLSQRVSAKFSSNVIIMASYMNCELEVGGGGGIVA